MAETNQTQAMIIIHQEKNIHETLQNQSGKFRNNNVYLFIIHSFILFIQNYNFLERTKQQFNRKSLLGHKKPIKGQKFENILSDFRAAR